MVKFFDAIAKVGQKVKGGVERVGRKVGGVAGVASKALEGIQKVQGIASDIDRYSGGLIGKGLGSIPIIGKAAQFAVSSDAKEGLNAAQSKLKKLSKAAQLAESYGKGDISTVGAVSEGVKIAKGKSSKKGGAKEQSSEKGMAEKPEFAKSGGGIPAPPPLPAPSSRKRPEIIESEFTPVSKVSIVEKMPSRGDLVKPSADDLQNVKLRPAGERPKFQSGGKGGLAGALESALVKRRGSLEPGSTVEAEDDVWE